MEATLLLNASYEPLKVISWQRAITLIFLGKVEVVNEYNKEVRSVSLALKVPAVVRLLGYARIGKKRPPLNRTNLIARDQCSCQYCHIELSPKDTTVDHVIPRSKGGLSTWENVVIACRNCNRKKGGRTPKEAGMKLRIEAKAPEWLPILNIRFHRNLPEAWLIFLE
jgi:5-methylcytosine-specific restriction endonuclease McrA